MTTTTTKSVQELTAKIAEYTKIPDLTIRAWSGKVLGGSIQRRKEDDNVRGSDIAPTAAHEANRIL